MPVRKIPKNYRFPTGEIARGDGGAAGFEGTLERDYLILTRFDATVLRFDEQPVSLEYIDESGIKRTYTPDLLIEYISAKKAKPSLVEVKPRKLLRENMAEYVPKFRAAVRHCRANGWKFVVRHEGHIRTPQLEVVKQLRPYVARQPDEIKAMALVNLLRKSGPHKIAEVLEKLCPNPEERVHWLPVIWICIAHKKVAADLSGPITPKTVLSSR